MLSELNITLVNMSLYQQCADEKRTLFNRLDINIILNIAGESFLTS